MRFIHALWLLLISAIAVSAQKPAAFDSQNLQTAYCPQTHDLEVEPSQKFFLEGTIGKRPVRMYLDRGGSGVVGLFFDIGADWQTTLLGGTWSHDSIDASDAANDHPATAHLSASLRENHLKGIWTQSGTSQPERVDLTVIPEPRCDGKGPWKRFEDPDWPVTFSYPASWHLDKSNGDDSITLTCPNPSEIAFDQHILIHRGTGAPEGPTKMVQCGDSWIYGFQCRCGEQDSSRCPTAKASRMKSVTVLDVSEQEHRIYCLHGGYAAAGEGEDRVVMLRDQWLEIDAPLDTSGIMKRLIESITMRKHIQPE
ncbi:hypothetical protein [Occallatibacter savannae]|uniref:hypothetical protein n=1 Tax=Occallatibacter savannae TaxID=1002691 RepID=UPI000D68D532|nr:hypothetical protein [Occallatibacter savannae]